MIYTQFDEIALKALFMDGMIKDVKVEMKGKKKDYRIIKFVIEHRNMTKGDMTLIINEGLFPNIMVEAGPEWSKPPAEKPSVEDATGL